MLVNGTTAPSATYTASRITSLTISFNTTIQSVDAAAFTLTRGATTLTNGGGGISVAGTGTNALTLSFTTATGVEYGSLADGIWTLSTNRTKVYSIGGAGTGTVTTNHIRRLFGDGNGDGTVNLEDNELFGNAFGTSDARFDYNADGVVNTEDYEQFGARYGTSL